MSRVTRSTVVAATLVVALAAVGGGVAIATGGNDDTDTPITGSARERASEAALAEVGEGRVTETEAGDEESFYEVEVTLDDGTEVDVQLDEQFRVVSTEADDADEQDDDQDEPDDRDEPEDRG